MMKKDLNKVKDEYNRSIKNIKVKDLILGGKSRYDLFGEEFNHFYDIEKEEVNTFEKLLEVLTPYENAISYIARLPLNPYDFLEYVHDNNPLSVGNEATPLPSTLLDDQNDETKHLEVLPEYSNEINSSSPTLHPPLENTFNENNEFKLEQEANLDESNLEEANLGEDKEEEFMDEEEWNIYLANLNEEYQAKKAENEEKRRQEEREKLTIQSQPINEFDQKFKLLNKTEINTFHSIFPQVDTTSKKAPKPRFLDFNNISNLLDSLGLSVDPNGGSHYQIKRDKKGWEGFM